MASHMVESGERSIASAIRMFCKPNDQIMGFYYFQVKITQSAATEIEREESGELRYLRSGR